MVRGTNVHDAVEVYYNQIMPHLDELYTLMQRDKREEALALALSVMPEKEYTLGEEPIIEMRIKGDLERLLGEGPDNYLPIINETEVHAFAEEQIEFNGETVTIPVHYAGSIDRGFAEKDGGVALMELKTGKWVQTKNKDGEWNDSKFKLKSMRTEMAYYKHLLKVANHEHQNVTHWGWVYPSGSVADIDTLNKYGYEQRAIDRIYYEPCTGRTNTTYKKIIKKITNALLTAYLAEDFPTSPSAGKCSYCSFKSICPSWEGSDDPQEYRDNYEGDDE